MRMSVHCFYLFLTDRSGKGVEQILSWKDNIVSKPLAVKLAQGLGLPHVQCVQTLFMQSYAHRRSPVSDIGSSGPAPVEGKCGSWRWSLPMLFVWWLSSLRVDISNWVLWALVPLVRLSNSTIRSLKWSLHSGHFLLNLLGIVSHQGPMDAWDQDYLISYLYSYILKPRRSVYACQIYLDFPFCLPFHCHR